MDIDIRTPRKDELEVRINMPYVPFETRVFTMLITQDGIRISAEKNLAVMPLNVNAIRVDYA